MMLIQVFTFIYKIQFKEGNLPNFLFIKQDSSLCFIILFFNVIT